MKVVVTKGGKMAQDEISISVEQAYLEALLQPIFGEEKLKIIDWKISPLSGGLEFGSAIYRLQGIVEWVGKPQTWSLILKIIQSDAQHNDPSGFRYWKREAEAYRSGMLQKLPGPVTAPSSYAVQERPDGSIWIWLEDIRDDLGSTWTVDHYRLVASHLGQLNGAYLAGQPLPGEAWVTHDWLRKYLEHAAPMVAFLQKNPSHPIVQKMLPGTSLLLTLAIWDERLRILKVLAELPQTFCHQDAFERNLFIQGEQVVGIDWGYAGIAPLGAELAPLIGVAATLGSIPSSQLKQLDQACFEGYLEGLKAAGCTPDARQARLGYTITVLLRYVLGATVGEVLPALLESEEARQRWADGFGISADKVEETDAGVAAYYQSITIEALRLLGLGCLARVLLRTGRYAVSLDRKHNQAGAESFETR
jgi:hypothetical protein